MVTVAAVAESHCHPHRTVHPGWRLYRAPRVNMLPGRSAILVESRSPRDDGPLAPSTGVDRRRCRATDGIPPHAPTWLTGPGGHRAPDPPQYMAYADAK